MDKQKIKYIIIDSLLLFATILPSVFYIKGVGLSVLFGFLFLAFSAGAMFLLEYAFGDTERSKWKILLPFVALSLFANLFCQMSQTLPFLLAEIIIIYSKKISLIKKAYTKKGTEIKLHPHLSSFALTVFVFCVLFIFAEVVR